MADINPGDGLNFLGSPGKNHHQKSAGKGVARRVDLSTLWFPSPTFFPIGNTSTNWWDFLKPKLHARFLGHTSKLPTDSHQV